MRLAVSFVDDTGRLSDKAFIETARYHYDSSLRPETLEIEFDLSSLTRVELHPLSMLLSWTSKVRSMDKSTTWILPPCSPLSAPQNSFRLRDRTSPTKYRYEDLLGTIELSYGAGASKEVCGRLEGVERLVRDRLREGKSPGKALDLLETIHAELVDRFPQAKDYIFPLVGHVRQEFQGMRLVGFLDRLGVFGQLAGIGTRIVPTNFRQLAWPFASTAETGTLPLTPLLSAVDVQQARDRFSDELRRVFGQYADIDAVRSGALSNVIVEELGKNITDHAKASLGAVATRIVWPEQTGPFANLSINGEGVDFFRAIGRQGFLEVEVFDDGIGIPASLREEIAAAWKARGDLKARYPKNTAEPKPDDFLDWEVIEFAFDRLSSSKRSLTELFEPPELVKRVASGLYWVWNQVLTLRGFLLVHSGGTEVGYDFSTIESTGQYTRHIGSCPMAGTQVWACFPLGGGATPATRIGSRPPGMGSYPARFHFHWAGDFCSRLSVSELDGRPDKDRIGKLYLDLKRSFETAAEKQCALAIDLTGAHREWIHGNAQYLANALLALNYISPLGIHMTALFNAPIDRRAVLLPALAERAERLADGHPQLAALSKAAAVFWDDASTIDFIAPRAVGGAVLRLLANVWPADLSVDDIVAGLSTEPKWSLTPQDI
ncbi:MAG: hypothetical protein V1694_02085, partial [Candidatus Eisenbacteria bacterium]